jgi:hypothetical protein
MTENPATGVRPPRSWEWGTIALMLLIAATAGVGAVTAAVSLALAPRYLRGDGEQTSPVLTWILANEGTVAALSVLLMLGYIVGYFVWRHRTRVVLTGFVADPRALIRHWGVPAWVFANVAAVLLRWTANDHALVDVDDAIHVLRVYSAASLIRGVGLGCLVFAVWTVRNRVRAELAAYRSPWQGPYGAPAFTPPPPPPPTVSATPRPPAQNVPGIEDLPFADEDFWRRVRQAAAGSELALLETSGPGAHRWVLIPAGAEMTAVREKLAAGSAITVFTEPPGRQPTDEYKAPPATGYHGLLESAETGALWYLSTTPRRLPQFLKRAAISGRWALYPVDSPGALTARLA